MAIVLGYSGVFLVSRSGLLLLQLRDDKPDITHPGGVCTFGGGIEPGETPLEAALREIEEETELVLPAHSVAELGQIEKQISESHVLTGHFYAAFDIDEAAMTIHEGSLITLSYAQARAHPKMTPHCAQALDWLDLP